MKSIGHLTQADFENFFRSHGKRLDFMKTDYFKKVMEFVKDDKLVEGVKFANDVTKVPPIVSFIMAYDDFFAARGQLTSNDKTGLTLCIRYIFCIALNGGYTVHKTQKTGRAADYGINQASIFAKGAK